jgi:hypothetical protein
MNNQTGLTAVEERRLTEWLETSTPQPPRVLTAEVIMARAPTARPGHRWMPMLAAATVAAVVIVGIAIAATRGEKDGAPPAAPSTSAPVSTASPSSSPSPPRTASPGALAVHPWHAQRLGTLQLAADSTTVLDGRLYGAVDREDSARWYRLDPSTGAPLAHADHLYGGLQPVAAAGLVWIPAAGTREVLGLDPVTLAVKTTVRVQAKTGIATQGADTVVVSDAHRVSFIRSGTVAHQLTIRHPISSIAMSADGTRLFVGTQQGSIPGPGQIETLDPTTGSPLAAPVRGVAMVLGLQATSGGLWYTSIGGMQAAIGFQPYQGHEALNSESGVGHSGGGTLTFPSISDGVAWLGSTDELGCADPDTGALRAHLPVGSRHGLVSAEISGLTVLDGKVFAVYNGINGGPANALIVMRPPAKCFSD